MRCKFTWPAKNRNTSPIRDSRVDVVKRSKLLYTCQRTLWKWTERRAVTDLPILEPDNEYDVEEIEHDPPMTVRSLARRVALQVLYELDCTAHLPEQVIEARLSAQNPEDNTPDRGSARYVRIIVYGVLKHRTRIDRAIRYFAPEWPLEQVAIVDRNILRIALFEFAVSRGVPVNVAIDEAVALAQMFGAEGSTAFVNGVLGQAALQDGKLQAVLNEPANGEVDR